MIRNSTFIQPKFSKNLTLTVVVFYYHDGTVDGQITLGQK
jgi:hypothetical protein